MPVCDAARLLIVTIRTTMQVRHQVIARGRQLDWLVGGWCATRRIATLMLFAAQIAMLAGCGSGDKLPPPASQEYRDAVSAFYSGLAALQVGNDVYADTKLGELTKLAPGEPAGWANWAVLALRQQNFDLSAQRLSRARDLAPQDGHVYGLLGVLESSRGRGVEAIAALRKAAELDPGNLRVAYALAQAIERQGDQTSPAEFQQVIESILAKQPDNLAALLELSRVAARRGDAAKLQATVAKINAQSTAWPTEAREQLATLQAAVDSRDLRAAATRTTILRNVLLRVPEYRLSQAAIKAPPGEEAQPITRPLRLAAPAANPAPADTALTFARQPGSIGGAHWDWAGAIQLGSAGAPIFAVANNHEVRLASGATLAFAADATNTPPTPESVLQIDFTYDFKTDLVLAGAGGVRLYRQDGPSAFVDVTAQTKLPRSIIDGHYTGAWAIDFDADGDLDIVLGTSQGVPVLLRNNGDGTFLDVRPFAGVSGLRQLAWADLDGDGNPDVAMIDASGNLHVFTNERQGQFRERRMPPGLGTVKAIAVADANGDGVLDLLVVKADGAIVRLSDKDEGNAWEIADVAKVPNAAEYLSTDVRLHVGDLDNNGVTDFFLAPVAPMPGKSPQRALFWLGNPQGTFTLSDQATAPSLVFDAADLNGDGKLDLVGLSDDGQSVQAMNQGAKNYHWQVIRPRAAQAFGDQRINPFGVGGEVEIRSGFLVQKQPITGPQVHFGLGDNTIADIVRVIWPNGAVRAEFAVKADQEVITEQRLKGSCPFLFAFNGKAMDFVKDAVPWSSAIGLRINTLGSADIVATEEWYKIGRDQLVPHDGFYDLRITAELWEVYYYDYLALMTVDHPVGTEIFVDERFVIPPAKLAITTVATPHPIAKATDDSGNDVTDILRNVDGKLLDNFGHGQYQGVTRDHYVEIDLGDNLPTSGPLYLIANGSIYPTDSSINVAMTQGDRWRAHSLSLEVADGHGGWVVADANLGFPAGRKKNMLIDLTKAFRAGAPHKLRLRTNLELYWDQMQWAQGVPNATLSTRRIDPSMADLHYRGYSVIERPGETGPELPDYNRLSGTKQRWRDLIGYYTRFGDVRELLKKTDDRYVIMNSGDEMSLRFDEQPPPAAGLVRDFIIMGDGWIKDGDYNSTFSKTVLPLPYHAQREYNTPPGRLEDEWAYRNHPDDWQNFHTRYVTPDVFNNALRDQPEQ
jgi:Tfp pilus assembly protein PilF